MIRVTNIGVMIAGNNVETSAEMTMLLNEFYSQAKDRHGEERANELMEFIGKFAIDGTEPIFLGNVNVEIGLIGGLRLQGNEPDIVQAIGAATGALYKLNVEHIGEDDAKEWLAYIGQLAVKNEDELAEMAETMRNSAN